MIDPALRAAALAYVGRGFSLVHCKPREKKPVDRGWLGVTLSSEDVERIWGNDAYNVGVKLGDASGGLVEVALESAEALAAAAVFFPDHPAVTGYESKPLSHYWFVAKGATTRRFRDSDAQVLLELRASGEQTLLPPSVHPSGQRFYCGYRADSAADLMPPEIDAAELRAVCGQVAAAALLARFWPKERVGLRAQAAKALSYYLLRSGMPSDEASTVVGAAAHVAKDPQLGAYMDDVPATARRMLEDESYKGESPSLEELFGEATRRMLDRWLGFNKPSTPKTPIGEEPKESPQCTDLGNSIRFTQRFHEDLKVLKSGGWLAWDGVRWASGEHEAQEYAKKVSGIVFDECMSATDAVERRQLWEWALKSQASQRISAVMQLARTDRRIVRDVNAFDTDLWGVTFQNGYVDLRTAQLSPHDKARLSTHVCPVDYDADADCPRWDRFMREVCCDDLELVKFIQRAVGYSMTGLTTEHALLLLYGSGSNGKSTFLETLRLMLGDYSRNTAFDTFLSSRFKADKSEHVLSQLYGVRFVTAIEAEEGAKIAEALIKNVTGGDTITARALYEKYFDYSPQFKVWLAANHRPRVHGTDEGFWRRIHLIPFTAHFKDKEQQKDLRSVLTSELPGIAAWAVRGCLEWRAIGGLKPPPSVTGATKDYREGQDLLAQWLTDCCSVAPKETRSEFRVTAADAYKCFSAWCSQEGERPWAKKTLGIRLQDLQFEKFRTKREREWIGFELNDAGRAIINTNGHSNGMFSGYQQD